MGVFRNISLCLKASAKKLVLFHETRVISKWRLVPVSIKRCN